MTESPSRPVTADEVIKAQAKMPKTGRTFSPPSEELLMQYYDRDEEMRLTALNNKVPFICEASQITLYPGLVLIGGVTGNGKSTLAANLLAGFLASRTEGTALVISNEEGLGSIYNRVSCVLQGLSFKAFHNGMYNEQVRKGVRTCVVDLVKRIKIVQMQGWDTSVMEDVQAVLEYAGESKAGLVLADYWQTVNSSRLQPLLESYSIHKRLGFWLKEYSRRVPMPVVFLAQLTGAKDKPEFKERVENDKTIVNHAFQTIEVCPDFEASQTTFKVHKVRFGGQANYEVTMKFVDGRYEMESRL